MIVEYAKRTIPHIKIISPKGICPKVAITKLAPSIVVLGSIPKNA